MKTLLFGTNGSVRDLASSLITEHGRCFIESHRGTRIVPELTQEAFTPDAAAAEALRVLTDPAHAARVKRDLADVRVDASGHSPRGRATGHDL